MFYYVAFVCPFSIIISPFVISLCPSCFLKYKVSECQPNVKLIKLFNTKKASMFCPTKDKVTKEQKANVVYKIICPGCNNVYVGKTDRCFGIRMNEHGTR